MMRSKNFAKVRKKSKNESKQIALIRVSPKRSGVFKCNKVISIGQ
jgi:hypothetical protein